MPNPLNDFIHEMRCDIDDIYDDLHHIESSLENMKAINVGTLIVLGLLAIVQVFS